LTDTFNTIRESEYRGLAAAGVAAIIHRRFLLDDLGMRLGPSTSTFKPELRLTQEVAHEQEAYNACQNP
jgi:hypothetical protein